MSWLSDRTGIHIGNGPKKVDFAPPPEIANNPAALAEWQQMMDKVNGTIGQAQKLNTGAEVVAGTAIGAEGLGMLGGGAGAGAEGGALPVAGDVAGAGAGASIVDKALAAAKIGGSFFLDFLKNHGGDLLQAANVANAAYNQTKASDYANKAYNTANDAYSAKAPLRTAGIAGMLNPSANTPDLSSLKSIAGENSGNPFAPKGLPVAGMPGGSPPMPTPGVNGPPPGPPMAAMLPGGSQTAPRPLPIQRAPQPGLIPRPGNGAVLS